jgi:hypothetical protein
MVPYCNALLVPHFWPDRPLRFQLQFPLSR